MRKIIVLSFISLDGVMQAPGGPDEDRSAGFTYGGWTVPYFDEFCGQEMGRQMDGTYDLLLGRKTFDIFASYWPDHEDSWPTINTLTKYVASKTLTAHAWKPTVFLNDIEAIKKLKQSDGPPLQVHGSGELIQALMKHDLVDEFWLKIFPVTLGSGKRLFGGGSSPLAFELVEAKTSPSGVIFATYKKSGKVQTGTFGD